MKRTGFVLWQGFCLPTVAAHTGGRAAGVRRRTDFRAPESASTGKFRVGSFFGVGA